MSTRKLTDRGAQSMTTAMAHSTLTASCLVGLMTVAPVSLAEDHEDEIPFAVAEVFFELNNTDGDLGIHALIDGEPWRKLTIEDPNERKMLGVNAKGRLQRQGLTELFFESAEPPFTSDDPDEVTLTPEEFFNRFPEGEYEVAGVTLEGDELESVAQLTHVMPAPAAPTVNGQPLAEVCDPEDPDYDAPVVSSPVTIAWDPVTMSHPDPLGGGAAVQPPVPVTIHNYEVVAEVELELNGEEFASVFSIILPPGETSVTLPAEFIGQGDTFKYEVLAREESFNQTAVETCFVLDDAE